MGHEVHFFSMKDERNKQCIDEKYFVKPRDYNNKHGFFTQLNDAMNLIWSHEAYNNFEAMLQDIRPDVVHLNLVHRQISLSILDTPSLRSVPVVYTAHEYILVCPTYTMIDGNGINCDSCVGGHFYNCVLRKCIKNSRSKSVLGAIEAYFIRARRYYQRFDKIICPSSYVRSMLLCAGFNSEKTEVFPNCFEIEPWLKAGYSFDGTVSSGNGNKLNAFVYFGRLSKEKGVDLLIRAFLKFYRRNKDWKLYIVGDGPERDSLEKMVKESNSTLSIIFTGKMNGESLHRMIARAKYAVVCSRWRETFGYTIVEAQAAGTPVIGANIGAIPENIIEGKTGYLFQPDIESELCDTLHEASSIDEESYQRMRVECRKHAMDVCDIEKYAAKIVGVYEKLVAMKCK